MLQKTGVSLFSPARIAIPPQLGQSLHPPRRVASDNRAVNRRRPADKPAHALRQPQVSTVEAFGSPRPYGRLMRVLRQSAP